MMTRCYVKKRKKKMVEYIRINIYNTIPKPRLFIKKNITKIKLKLVAKYFCTRDVSDRTWLERRPWVKALVIEIWATFNPNHLILSWSVIHFQWNLKQTHVSSFLLVSHVCLIQSGQITLTNFC